MNATQTFTLAEAHKEFALRANAQVWDLLAKAGRTPEEDETMLYSAYASQYHWMQAGGPVQRQRGEWLIARVHAARGEAGLALRHARRCLELTEAHRSEMKDFDLAYAYEGMSKALALAGDAEASRRYLALAEEAGEAIANVEDKHIFMGDLRAPAGP